ncbi:MAG: hypothetical protein KDB57_04345 [Solirubrobacterales bacterium]|nr:hypothetical protein [Solirubrobacterales bacterium]
MKKTTRKALDGRSVLYGYLQGELLRSDVWLFQMLVARLVVGLGVWASPEIYARYPLLRPYAVRDPKCRGNKKKGIPDQWGSPNKKGFFRDDNSLVKRLPYSLPLSAPKNSAYDGALVSKGFVASHIWRILKGENGLASRHWMTYSFVPNLVWLPAEVSKLTDREGSFVQAYVQALSIKIYRNAQISPELEPLVEEIWDLLPTPTGIPSEGLPDPNELNYFVPDDAFFSRRIKDLHAVMAALELVRERRPLKGKVVAKRYSQGLSDVSLSNLEALSENLSTYRDAIAPD